MFNFRKIEIACTSKLLPHCRSVIRLPIGVTYSYFFVIVVNIHYIKTYPKV